MTNNALSKDTLLFILCVYLRKFVNSVSYYSVAPTVASSWAFWCDNNFNFFKSFFFCLPVENLILFCKIYISPICSTYCFKIFGVMGFFSPLFHL